MLDKPADLLIEINRQLGTYTVRLQYTPPDDRMEDVTKREQIQIDFDGLARLSDDDKAYGAMLADQVLPGTIRSRLAALLTHAERDHLLTRVRLFIDPSAAEVQNLSWERLPDPTTPGAFLLQRDDILFSRYLYSSGARQAKSRTQRRLRVLVARANPGDLYEARLPPVDIPFERIKGALRGETVEDLGQPATIEAIVAALTRDFDVLCLAAHGQIDALGQPRLLLDDGHGRTLSLDGRDFVKAVEGLERTRPALVVLLSCDSAGEVKAPATSAVASLLADVGVPAVVGMQGRVSLDDAITFLGAFFLSIGQHGLLDRAVADGRQAIKASGGWWRPVLLTRLKTGKLFYEAGIITRGREDQVWAELLNAVKRKRLTPVLGPGLTEYLLGTRREMALRFASTLRFLWSPGDRESLPQVAHYRLYQGVKEDILQDELVDFLRHEVERRFGPQIRAHLGDDADRLLNPPPAEAPALLDDLVTRVAKIEIGLNLDEPHRLLAALDLPVYITANPGNLMCAALEARGRHPRVLAYRWKDTLPETTWEGLLAGAEERLKPTTEEPLVFHLFGRLHRPETITLSEDDYFDFLLHFNRHKGALPSVVDKALNEQNVLFLGFSPQDWAFRVLFRGLEVLEGRDFRKRFQHVAVQVQPDDVDEARGYLERYYESFAPRGVSVFLGNPETFLGELTSRLRSGV